MKLRELVERISTADEVVVNVYDDEFFLIARADGKDTIPDTLLEMNVGFIYPADKGQINVEVEI